MEKKFYVLGAGLVLTVVIIALILVGGKTRLIPIGPEAGQMNWRCGKPLTYQNATYNTVKIGNQCWTKENLNATKYRDGTPIPRLTANTDWATAKGEAYSCYDNKDENCASYGALYNWHAITKSTGLCPEGWSVPTHEQWTDLEKSICAARGYQNCETEFASDAPLGWRGKEEGNHLKSTAAGGLDTYGFTALFGGFRNSNGPFNFLNEEGFWWTTTPSGEFAHGRLLDKGNGGMRRFESGKSSGFSVRCLHD